MQIGKAFYCDMCGVNIWSGTHCNEYDPQHSEQVVITFLMTEPANNSRLQHVVNEQQDTQPSRPWWKIR